MRLIGQLSNEMHAKRFGDFLYSQSMDCQIDPGAPGSWEIWILDDLNVETGKRMLDQFVQCPENPRFVEAAQAVERKRKQDQQAQTGKRTRVIDGRTLFYTPPVPLGLLSLFLIGVCIVVALLTSLGEDDRAVQPFSITKYQPDVGYVPGLPEVRRGEVWRLFTPMFLHFGILHLFFNVLWLRDLGSMIEAHKSRWLLLLLVLILAGTSNLAQYLTDGPNFGGMSGVVYGLLGYIWMQGKFNPASKLSLQPQTVTLMIVWFFVCLTDLVGPIANTVHAVGFGVGIAWGFVAARLAVAARRG